jgi:hypothetical protein
MDGIEKHERGICANHGQVSHPSLTLLDEGAEDDGSQQDLEQAGSPSSDI